MKIVKYTLVLVTATLGACASKPVVNVSVSQNAASSSGAYSGHRSSVQSHGGSQSGAVAQITSSNLGDSGAANHQSSLAQSSSASGGNNAYPSPGIAQGGNSRITTTPVSSSVTQSKKSGSSSAVAQITSSRMSDAGGVSNHSSIANSTLTGNKAYPSAGVAQGGNTHVTGSSISTSVTQSKKSGSSSAVIGTWSGVSRGERITVKIGSNGSLILTNTSGANPGNWSSVGSGNYDVNIGGSGGRLVLVNSSTASLTIGGSSIELKKN
jgi:hypothetical protein